MNEPSQDLAAFLRFLANPRSFNEATVARLKKIADLVESHDQLAQQLEDSKRYLGGAAAAKIHLRNFLESFSNGWLYWPARVQADPRVVRYDSRTLDEIEFAAKKVLLESEMIEYPQKKDKI